MHKVHHHWKQPYTDSNYGAILSIWDRLLGTFMKLDPGQIRYGLDRYYPNEKDEDFATLMKKPFQGQKMGQDQNKVRTKATPGNRLLH